MMDEIKSEQVLLPIYDLYTPQEEIVPEPSPIVISHAILDCKKNWKNIAVALAENTKRKVYVLDVPDHDDDGPSQNITFEELYRGLENFLLTLGQPVVLIGHSIGAVLSITIATKQPEIVNRLVMIDISPVDYPTNTDDNILHCLTIMREALSAAPKGLSLQKTQNVIAKYFEKAIPSDIIRRMLIGNLKEGKDRIQWKCDLDSIEEEFRNNSTSTQYPLKCLCYTDTLLVYGEMSDFVNENDFNDMKIILPKLKLQCIKRASHWIHVEEPEKLTQVICDFLNAEK